MLKLKCPKCAKSITAPEAHAGKSVRCPNCMVQIIVPISHGATTHSPVVAPSPMEVGQTTPVEPQRLESNPTLEMCGNCDRSIGKLEEAFVWKQHVVCADCHAVLPKQQRSSDGNATDHANTNPNHLLSRPAPQSNKMTTPQKPQPAGGKTESPKLTLMKTMFWMFWAFVLIASLNLAVQYWLGTGAEKKSTKSDAASQQRLDSNSSSDRVVAVQALRTNNDPASADLLLIALKDPAYEVRSAAAIELALRREHRAVPFLLKMLSGSDLEKRTASEGLGLMQEKSAVERLIPLLRSKEIRVRNNAAEALGWIGDKKAITALQALYDTQDSYSTGEAAMAINRIEHPDSTNDPIAKFRKRHPTDAEFRAEFDAETVNAPHAIKEPGIVGSHPWWSLLILVVIFVGATLATPTRRIYTHTMSGERIAYVDVPTGEAPLAQQEHGIAFFALIAAVVVWAVLWLVGC